MHNILTLHLAASASESETADDSDVEGNLLACPGGNVTTAMERWSMENGIILNTPRYCELCLCTCMTPLNITNQQYFDMRPIVTNVKDGMIVSAVRFVKEQNVLRLLV